MPWDAGSGQTFGDYMRGDEPLGSRSVDVVGEPTWLTRDQVVEGRTEDGTRFQRVRSQQGHDVVRETAPDGRERQHVRINLA